jgi:hypothetical protein
MTLAVLSERAAADRRKCSAIKPPRPRLERIMNSIVIEPLVKPGGGCYMVPQMRFVVTGPISRAGRHPPGSFTILKGPGVNINIMMGPKVGGYLMKLLTYA